MTWCYIDALQKQPYSSQLRGQDVSCRSHAPAPFSIRRSHQFFCPLLACPTPLAALCADAVACSHSASLLPYRCLFCCCPIFLPPHPVQAAAHVQYRIARTRVLANFLGFMSSSQGDAERAPMKDMLRKDIDALKLEYFTLMYGGPVPTTVSDHCAAAAGCCVMDAFSRLGNCCCGAAPQALLAVQAASPELGSA